VSVLANEVQAVAPDKGGRFPDPRVAFDVHRVYGSVEYIRARRRVFRQLIQALIYEKTLQVRESESLNATRFFIVGEDANGHNVAYVCQGVRRPSFGRVRLTEEPLQRIASSGSHEADSIQLFLQEVRSSFTVVPEFLERFSRELEQTVLNDALGRLYCRYDARYLRDRAYDDMESGLSEAHPYHPCFKSRIGFDWRDNVQFGPEFSPVIRPLWLAVRKTHCFASISDGGTFATLWKEELGVKALDSARQRVALLGERFEDYLLLPVHPWQWRKIISAEHQWDLHNRHIIYLGEGEDDYRPQQSIRTLANVTHPRKCYTKLALSIVNTSTSRGLAQHTVANAPIISDWLHAVARADDYLANDVRPVFLREVAAVSYQSPVSNTSPGSLACVWRESVHGYLEDGESAAPYSALTAMDRDGKPLIRPWVEHLGVKPWLQELLHVSVTPLIHMLYAHGIALESHAQNMVLLHRAGIPTRVALKDFHDGVRFMPGEVSLPEHVADVRVTPAEHLQSNSSSYIQTDKPDDVRDFLYSAFFSMNLSELALFMSEHFALPESDFWGMTRACVKRYQKSFPELAARFATFDLFAETVVVEAHTRRRLLSEKVQRVNSVGNPLAQLRAAAQGGRL
jgi:siderophore synthetase component